MTCIVAGKGWMAADRCVTEADGAKGSLVKIAKNPHLIAAAAGNATSTLDVRRAIRKGAQLVEDLIENVDKDSVALVMTPDGHLFKIQDRRVWSEAPGLSAIGSGGDLCIGWLLGVGCPEACPDIKACVRRAFGVVARRRADCGGGVDFRTFETGLAAVPRS
jgi:hypothetical protein